MKILGICGSARAKSFNAMAMHTVAGLLPAGITFEAAKIDDLPMYHQDEQAAGFPAAAERVIAQVRAADAVLFATPEYNWSIPALLKNAIDWVARAKDQPFAGKQMALMGATIGVFGTARSQLHLRDIMIPLDGRMMNRPPVMIPQAQNKFDADGKLTDQPTMDVLKMFAAALAEWAKAGKK